MAMASTARRDSQQWQQRGIIIMVTDENECDLSIGINHFFE
jgi:hypothetical protein